MVKESPSEEVASDLSPAAEKEPAVEGASCGKSQKCVQVKGTECAEP